MTLPFSKLGDYGYTICDCDYVRIMKLETTRKRKLFKYKIKTG